MSTLVSARDAIVVYIDTALSADHATLPVYYQNADEIDHDTLAGPYLFVKIEFIGSTQIDLSATPGTRHYGLLSIDVRVKVGTGTRSTLVLLDYLVMLTKYKSLSGVVLQAPSVQASTMIGTWRCQELLVPFWVDSIT